MTQQELEAAWQRYMHRTDLSEDLATVNAFANEKVTGRLLFSTVDLAQILADTPRMLFHAGMTYLAELAQDDEQLMREENRFEEAVSDYSYRRSLTDNPKAAMSRPYFDCPKDTANAP